MAQITPGTYTHRLYMLCSQDLTVAKVMVESACRKLDDTAMSIHHKKVRLSMALSFLSFLSFLWSHSCPQLHLDQG